MCGDVCDHQQCHKDKPTRGLGLDFTPPSQPMVTTIPMCNQTHEGIGAGMKSGWVEA